MKKIKYLFIMLFLLPFSVNAATCTNSEITRLRKMASNVTYDVSARIVVEDYEYELTDENENPTGEKEKIHIEGDIYDITFTNVFEGLYLYDENHIQRYYPENNTVKALNYSPGKTYNFSVRSTKCDGIRLSSVYVPVPRYNTYYNKEICEGYESLSVCQKWIKNSLTEEEVEAYIKKATEEKEIEVVEKEEVKGLFDYLLEYYIKYYYIALPATIIILLTIIILEKRKIDKESIL